MKKLFICLLITLFALGCVGCGNKDLLDTVYTYNRAVISMPDGEVIEGKVQQWSDYDGDQIQVKIDGKVYLVHSEDIVLIQE